MFVVVRGGGRGLPRPLPSCDPNTSVFLGLFVCRSLPVSRSDSCCRTEQGCEQGGRAGGRAVGGAGGEKAAPSS